MARLINSSASYQWLDEGRRLHLQHGPIDLIIEADGDHESVRQAYRCAYSAFENVLDDLVQELELLRTPLAAGSEKPEGSVAKRMYAAALPYCHRAFVTPMIAVAGSVADHVLQAMLGGATLRRAYVNNGGDIALWLAQGEQFSVGVCDNVETAHVGTRITLQQRDGVRGIATSGWRGRSCSLGIADAVTVLAADAATADAAATLIANAVDVPGCEGIHREPAVAIYPDSDLGNQPVTVGVEQLAWQDVELALDNGLQAAQQLLRRGLVKNAYISLQENTRICSLQTLGAGAMHA